MKKSFSEFGLSPEVLQALTEAGIETPTPIQERCIPLILEGKDVVGKAETGTGKTIGFAAPLIGRIDTERVSVQALVLTPTRELAQQVAGVFEQLSAKHPLGVALLVGGVHAGEQILKLRSASQVVVGTPGRVLDFLNDRTLSLSWCECVVLDEADRMLDMGFIDDVSAIIDRTPRERQTMLFSATIPAEIEALLKKYMRDPVRVSTSTGLSTVPDIGQRYIETEFHHKFRELRRVLDERQNETVLIFCNTRRQAIDLDRMLWGHGYSAGALHGDQEQEVRFRILDSFRRGDVKTLVATDVASRGLDVENVGCVVNYEVPGEVESYVHRIGRTGRAQKSGTAITLVSSREWDDWKRILEQTGFDIQREGPERVSKSGGGRRGGRGGRERGDRERGDRERGDRERGDRERGGRRRGGRERSERSGRDRGPRDRGARERPEPDRAGGAAGARPAAGGGGEKRGERGGEGNRRRHRGGRGGGKDGARRETPLPPMPPEEIPTAEEVSEFISQQQPRTQPQQPSRRRLEEVDDEFLRVEYFDVDSEVIARVPPAEREEREERASESGDGRSDEKNRSRRRRRRRSGRGAPQGGEGRETNARPQGEAGRQGGSGGSGSGENGTQKEGAPRGRRRRRGRGRRSEASEEARRAGGAGGEG